MRVLGTRELVVHCNNKEVLNVVIKDTTCDNSDWRDIWSKDVDSITFSQFDTASKYFKIGGCMSNFILILSSKVNSKFRYTRRMKALKGI